MVDWFTNHREIVLAFISCVAFILTIAQLIYSRVSKRTNLDISIEQLQSNTITDAQTQAECTNVFLLLSIINKSSSPINITRIIILVDNAEYPCYIRHTWAGEHHYPNFPETDIPLTERILTADFPIHLIPNGAVSEYVKFNMGRERSIINAKQPIKLKLSTNKKCVIKSLSCPQEDNTIFI